MEHRQLGRSGLHVPALGLGSATFGGQDDFSRALGTTDVRQASRLIDVALEAGACLFDSADIYSGGASEDILGQALEGRRERALLSTKAAFRCGPGPNDVGCSRQHLIEACESSLRRLRTDRIDLYQMHGFDALTPVEETLRALDDLVRAGKVRYVGCSNFSGWQLMKSLAVADREGLSRYVAHQAYYSVAGRDYEWELMPLGLDQGVGGLVWSPLSWGRLTGKLRRGETPPKTSRLGVTAGAAPPLPNDYLFGVIDVLETVAEELDRSVPQVAINWLLSRPSVSSVILGARKEEKLRDNLGAIGWSLSPEQHARLDAVSRRTPPYPLWQQAGFRERNPAPG
jgi:aryl-alcohol dehydrogenase-like predicted oxidoreductase